VHAGEDDDLGVGVAGRAGELQRVADVVGDVLDVGLLVVVREQDGLALALQGLDLVEQVDRRGPARGGAGDRGREGRGGGRGHGGLQGGPGA
jgi:hypothetical protein